MISWLPVVGSAVMVMTAGLSTTFFFWSARSFPSPVAYQSVAWSQFQRPAFWLLAGSGVVGLLGYWLLMSLGLSRRKSLNLQAAALLLAGRLGFLIFLLPLTFIPYFFVIRLSENFMPKGPLAFAASLVIASVLAWTWLELGEIFYRRRFWFWLFLACLLLAILNFSYLGVSQIYNLSTGTDYVLADQVAWNTSQGRLLGGAFTGESFLARHFSLSLLIPGFIYLFFSGPGTLYVIQAVFVCLGGLGVFLFTRDKTGDQFPAFCLGLAYLLYIPNQTVMLNNFHEIIFALPFFIWAFYLLEQKGRLRYLGHFFLILALTAKEDVLLFGTLIGLYYLIFRRKYWGLFYLIGSGLGFLFYTQWLIPYLTGGTYSRVASRFPALGSAGTGGLLGTMGWLGSLFKIIFNDPNRWYYIFYLFAPLFFLPLLSGGFLLLVLGSLAMPLLSASPQLYNIKYWYSVSITPFLFVASALVLGGLFARKKAPAQFLALYLLVFALISNSNLGLTLLNTNLPRQDYAASPRVKVLRQEFAPLIPAGSFLMSSEYVAIFFSHRPKMAIYDHRFPERWRKHLPDYIMIDGLTRRRSASQLKTILDSIEQGGRYELVKQRDDFWLYRLKP